MLDRVREALFSTLGERWEGAAVLDLFAGSGSLGLEALSRGARFARMVERDGPTAKLLTANVEALGVGERAQVRSLDALSPAAWRAADGERFDIAFLDPPYPLMRDGPGRRRVFATIERICAEALSPQGVIVLHTPRQLLSASEFAAFDAEERAYGGTSIWYVKPRADGAGA